MKFKFAVAALAGIASLALGSSASMANDAAAAAKAASGSIPAATQTFESSMVTTQGRGRGGGGIRGGRGGGGFAVAGRRRNNTGRNVAIGAGALILGGIIASQAASARPAGNSCGRWDYRCANGDGYSCRQLRRYC